MTCIDTCQAAGFTNKCDGNFGYCGCTQGQTIAGVNFTCEPPTNGCTTSGCPQVLNSYVCHKPATTSPPSSNCQTLGDTVATGKGKECCVPGTDTPVAVSVCGQCNATSKRNADQAVYCTCRCCAPCCPACANGTGKLCEPMATIEQTPSCSNDTSICGSACDPNFNYCDCPSGYTCTGIRTDVGLGDKQLAGAYCIKAGTVFTTTSEAMCGAGALGGYVGDSSCAP